MNKKIGLFASFILLMTIATAQDCSMYFPSKVGSVLTYVYSEKVDKPLSSCTYSLVSQETKDGVTINNIAGESFDKKDKSTMKFNFTSKCDGKGFFIDMKSYLSGMDMKNIGDFKIESSEVQIPSVLVAGQKLNDGWLTLTMEGPVTMTIKTTFTNRKVEAFEDVTTTAGTFKCVKISYETETEAMFMKTKTKVVEWYALNIGLVRSETFSDKGKMMGFNVLSSIK